jgi:hypothetical protein
MSGEDVRLKPDLRWNPMTDTDSWIHQDNRQVSSLERTNVKNGGLSEHWIDV